MLGTLRTNSFAAAASATLRHPDQSEQTRPRGIPLEGLLREIEASWHRGATGWDRRVGHRREFRRSAVLVPLDDQTEEQSGPALLVMTRDISAGGIAISCGLPLPYRKVSLAFVLPNETEVAVVTRLLWCRFTREGRYDSGGQFLRCLEPSAAG